MPDLKELDLYFDEKALYLLKMKLNA